MSGRLGNNSPFSHRLPFPGPPPAPFPASPQNCAISSGSSSSFPRPPGAPEAAERWRCGGLMARTYAGEEQRRGQFKTLAGPETPTLPARPRILDHPNRWGPVYPVTGWRRGG